MSQNVEVCLPLFFNRTLTYKALVPVQIGQIVEVPVKEKIYLGVVFGSSKLTSFSFDIKHIVHIYDAIIPEKCIQFIKWVSNYTLAPLGMILKMMLPIKTIQPLQKICSLQFNSEPLKLSEEQDQALQDILQHLYEKPVVLDGVTGSGKTEVYLALCQILLRQKKQILILLPEIALTAQVIERIAKHLGLEPFVWHSKVSVKKKEAIFMNALSGVPGIYIGARSALFLPYQNIGLIIIDEEHDSSYKQDEKIMYQARDMAVVKAKIEKAGILLCSATPSIETIVNIQNEKYHRVFLTNRFGEGTLPVIEIVDMKDTKGLISQRLKDLIQDRLDKKEQTLLFMNRRGYAPILLCKACGYKKNCPFCSTHLVFHKVQNKILCHYCGFYEEYDAPKCKECKTVELTPFGPGIERIHDEIQKIFSYARVLTVASDQMTTSSKLGEMREQILNNEVDIIIGTQILAKGHHFPNLTLVGVIDADMGLHGIDIRSTEKTYQMLHQVSGRSGREGKKGYVVIQTFNPLHPAILALASYNRIKFEEYEIADRKNSRMPPFSQLAILTLSGKHFQGVKDHIVKIYQQRPVVEGVDVFKPIPAPIRRLKMMFRYRVLVRAEMKSHILQDFINDWMKRIDVPSNMKLMIDVNPWNFM